MTALAVQPENAVALEGGGLINMIERLATNPATNVETLARLMDMQERVMDREAKAAFTAALVKVKPLLPVIERNGAIVIPGKDNKPGQRTPYALWEDIDAAITPILAEHDLVLSFRSGVAHDGKITVTGILSHAAGHSEETTITLPHDSSGSKNAVQAVGSSTSYGKRYTATLLLNIRTKGEDDDGKKGGTGELITNEHLMDLRDLIEATGSNVERFCKYLRVEKLADLPERRFEEAVAALKAKGGA